MKNNAARLYAMIGQATRIVRYQKAIFVAGMLLALSVLFVPVFAEGPKAEVPKADVVAAAGEAASFDAVIKPYLQQHCIRCHGPEVQKGKLSLENTGDQFATAKEVELWLNILDMLSFNDMPPPDEPQPKALETAKVVDWIKQRLEETGEAEAYRKKLISPEYGNWVSHEELFSGEITTPPFSPSRLWRFSGDIFDARNFHRAQSPFSYVTKETGIRDYAATSQVDRSTVQMIMINAEQWLEHREKRGEFKHFADDQPTPSDQVLEQTVRQEFKQIIRRDASDDEIAKYLAFLKKNIKDGGNLDGLKTMITAMFLAPEAIYRSEFGLGPEDEHGRRRLAPEEIAYDSRAAVEKMHLKCVAEMAEKLDKIPEGDGTMLDNTVIVYMSCAGGDHHGGQADWPFILLGGMSNKLKMGRYIEYPKYGEKGHRTIANLYLSLMQAAGMQTPETFGQLDANLQDLDLTGPLAELLV